MMAAEKEEHLNTPMFVMLCYVIIEKLDNILSGVLFLSIIDGLHLKVNASTLGKMHHLFFPLKLSFL